MKETRTKQARYHIFSFLRGLEKIYEKFINYIRAGKPFFAMDEFKKYIYF